MLFFYVASQVFWTVNPSVETKHHKVSTYKEYHSVCPSSELGLSQPLSRQRVFPSPQKQGGRGHTSLRVGGWGQSQFRRGACTVVLFICTYFVLNTNCIQLEEGDNHANPTVLPFEPTYRKLTTLDPGQALGTNTPDKEQDRGKKRVWFSFDLTSTVTP